MDLKDPCGLAQMTCSFFPFQPFTPPSVRPASPAPSCELDRDVDTLSSISAGSMTFRSASQCCDPEGPPSTQLCGDSIEDEDVSEDEGGKSKEEV